LGWGIKVSNVEIKRIDLERSMVRAIARQAEAERSRRAKVINALGEEQAAQKLLEAAQILQPVPRANRLDARDWCLAAASLVAAAQKRGYGPGIRSVYSAISPLRRLQSSTASIHCCNWAGWF
jgi:regulator of protease activity HflC (stomatin/prohibitin superfamily)